MASLFMIGALPWIVDIVPNAVEVCRRVSRYDTLYGEKNYIYKLFEFPDGTSKKMMAYRIRKNGYEPANPAQMLAFAEQGFKVMPHFGEFQRYVIGLGGELQTVLGCQFQGMGVGNVFFFTHLPQNRRVHEGGYDCRFLGVRCL
jgi:hypothetical protein